MLAEEFAYAYLRSEALGAYLCERDGVGGEDLSKNDEQSSFAFVGPFGVLEQFSESHLMYKFYQYQNKFRKAEGAQCIFEVNI